MTSGIAMGMPSTLNPKHLQPSAKPAWNLSGALLPFLGIGFCNVIYQHVEKGTLIAIR